MAPRVRRRAGSPLGSGGATAPRTRVGHRLLRPDVAPRGALGDRDACDGRSRRAGTRHPRRVGSEGTGARPFDDRARRETRGQRPHPGDARLARGALLCAPRRRDSRMRRSAARPRRRPRRGREQSSTVQPHLLRGRRRADPRRPREDDHLCHAARDRRARGGPDHNGGFRAARIPDTAVGAGRAGRRRRHPWCCSSPDR